MFVRTESFREFIKFYPVITAIVAINIIIYLLMNIPGFIGDIIFGMFVGVNFLIAEGEYWRFLTPVFSHVALTHALFNCFSLILFGPPLERLLGRVKFLIVYISAGVLANIATYFLEPLSYSHLGASGAIFGLFGFYIAILLANKNVLPFESRQIIVTIVVISLVMTFLQPNINITAHLFGLVAGFLAGMLFPPKNRAHYY